VKRKDRCTQKKNRENQTLQPRIGFALRKNTCHNNFYSYYTVIAKFGHC